MSAVWLKLITILCCTVLSESSGVIRKNIGGAFTIQCRSSSSDEESLSLTKGLDEYQVLFTERELDKSIITQEFIGRLQLNGVFPSVDILIKNLTSDDTGLYWCVYSKFDEKSSQRVINKGTGSVLLVVKGAGQGASTQCPCPAAPSGTVKECEPANKDLVLVSVVISTAVLLGIIIGIAIWIIKTKNTCSTVKPSRVTTSDVYEDMRGTLRH